MTKTQVSKGHKWLDMHLEDLFRIYLPCNPLFKQSTKVPCRLDMIPTLASMMNYAQALCRSIPSLPSDPTKEKKYARKPVPRPSFRLIYDQQEFPTLAKSMPTSNSRSLISGNSNISAVGSFSSDQQYTSSTQPHTNVAQTVDLAALKSEMMQEIMHSLLDDFKVILHQELATIHSELQSSLTVPHQQPSADKLPDPTAVLNTFVQPELAALHAEIKTTVAEMKESIMLLSQQIQVYEQPHSTNQKPPKGKQGQLPSSAS